MCSPSRRARPAITSGSKERAFEKHVARVRLDAGRGAAHDAGQRARTAVIGDHQHVGAEFDHPLVEQRELFAVLRHAHDETAFKRIQIEAVQRLPELEHHQVGHIHHRMDRP